MNALRGSLYMGVLGVFVLAAGCQGEETTQTTDAKVAGESCVDGCDNPAADEGTTDAETDVADEEADAANVESSADATLVSGVGCGKGTDTYEPNDKRGKAINAPLGVTKGLSICSGDEDWFRVAVPASTIVRVGIEMNHDAGDLDLVVYDEAGRLVGGRYGKQYPSSWSGFETDTEFYGLYSEQGDAVYHVRVVGKKGVENDYSLHVDHFPYADGSSCTGAGFSLAECIGQGPSGSGLLPFPFPDPNDSTVGAGYEWESAANYRFARRELIMLVRHALAETIKAFPNTTALSLLDVCQKDGITPGYDVGSPRHPQSTHDQGGNIDIAYFQTDGANDGEIVCGDGATHGDGYCTKGATKTNFVDFPRQAFFMAKLFASPRTRVVGTDTVLAPLIADAAKALAALPKGHPQRITSNELAGFESKMAYGSGWPYHHHHIHLSMNWWTSKGSFVPDNAAPLGPSEHSMAMPE